MKSLINALKGIRSKNKLEKDRKIVKVKVGDQTFKLNVSKARVPNLRDPEVLKSYDDSDDMGEYEHGYCEKCGASLINENTCHGCDPVVMCVALCACGFGAIRVLDECAFSNDYLEDLLVCGCCGWDMKPTNDEVDELIKRHGELAVETHEDSRNYADFTHGQQSVIDKWKGTLESSKKLLEKYTELMVKDMVAEGMNQKTAEGLAMDGLEFYVEQRKRGRFKNAKV